MPELPEITCRARELNDALADATVSEVEILQPKCLNVPSTSFREAMLGNRIRTVSHHGKWLIAELARGHLLINLGMGGEILLVQRGKLPDKWRIRFDMDAGRSLALNFWWFGYVHYVASGGVSQHPMVGRLGPDALELSVEGFEDLLRGRRGRIKPLLLDQSKIAGIGNAYIHDILFRARIHPLSPISSLREQEIRSLHASIRQEITRSIAKGGAFYELNLYGERGGFTADDLLVGYREGKPCPVCGTAIEKIRTGSTSGFICPVCQPLPA